MTNAPMIKTATAAAGSLCLALVGPASAGSDEDAVGKLLHGAFDRPDAPLVVDPTVTAGDHAVAGWTQGATGGRALLRKRDGQWVLILCGGDGHQVRRRVEAGRPL